MLKNYLKIAFRNLSRNKIYSIINISGLAVGITGAVLLYLYINNELSYDAFHEKADRTYRIVEIAGDVEQGTRYFGQTAPVLGTTLEEIFPEVEEMVRVYKPSGHIDMEWKGERIHERNWLMTERGFFEIFDFEFTHGSSETALSRPNSVVISKRKAEQLFNDENPIGKVLPFTWPAEATVTGVVENIPDNSHLQFDILMSRQNTALDWSDYLSDWETYGAYTYLVLNKSTDMASFKGKLDSFIQNQREVNENARNFYLQPIIGIYFNSDNIEFGIEQAHGNIFYIYIFTAIGIFLLLIAGINYINLTTAQSARRGREIGIRKAAGAEKQQLIFQFLAESVLVAFVACLISWFLMELSLPFFNELTGKNFVLNWESAGSILLVLLAFGLGLGILSGSYPAFYLALMRPVRVIKSKSDIKGKNLTLRKVLVVIQFALSIVLIIGTLAAYKQMNYIQSADLGFDKEQMLVVDINHGAVRSRFDAMKQELEKLPGVHDVATSSRVPGEWKTINQVFAWSLETGSTDSVQTYFMSFDEDMPGLYDLEISSGSNFIGNKQVDSLTVLINEAAVEALNLENPVGSFLDISESGKPMKVVGVLKNFHYQSLHKKLAPLIVGYWSNPVRVIDYFSIKLDETNIPETIGHIKEVHRQFDPETSMEYHFLDRQIEQSYRADIRAGRLFAIGGGVTIFIACMGLFGLAMFATETRTREIGVRKVLGASIRDILMLLTSDFVKLVIIAFAIAVPIGWIVMNNWLNKFAFHTNMGISIFIVAGISALLLSIITVSWQAIKASLINPVESLRSE